jgi:tetratricopeptide (TPR) repeat protein/tRNA A-37 threonylcarbamoyl transferase component Bud32
MLAPGIKLGPYEIQAAIGAGGMGDVYRALDTRLDRIVAIKVLPAHIASDPHVRERFHREARAISHLNNPHICGLHDIGDTLIDGGPSSSDRVSVSFLVLEYLEGQTLADRLKGGPLRPAEALEIAMQIVRALKEAHRHDIVHRDLKPANIMLVGALPSVRREPLDPDQPMVVKLLDFGLAKVTTEPRISTFGSSIAATRASITGEGAILGTFKYMAPEQLEGLAATAAADIWALGCVLHEMLTGRDVRTRTAVKPGRLNRLLDRCLAASPADRPSAADVASDLRAIRHDLARHGSMMKSALVAAAVLLIAGVAFIARRLPTSTATAPSKPVTVLIADFDNQTGEAVFDGTVEHAIGLALEDSRFVSTYPRQDAAAAARVIESNARLDERISRLVAQREGIGRVVAGVVARENTGYIISARVLDPRLGAVDATATERIADRSTALQAIGRLGVELRRNLGERNLSKDSLPSDETFTTSSLDAAREYVIAQDQLTSGRCDEAVGHYRKALEHDPQLGRAYSGWSVCDHERGDMDSARLHMAKALELLPRMSRHEQLRTQGLNLISLVTDYQRASEVYETLLREYPGDTSAQNNLTFARFMLLDFPGAKMSAAALVPLAPNKQMYRSNLALYGMYAGDFDLAVREARQAIALNPKNGLTYVPLAVHAAYTKDLAAAARWYDEMAKGDSRAQRLAAISRADLMTYTGDVEGARKVLAAAIPADIAAGSRTAAATKHLLLGELAQLSGDRRAAISEAGAATSLSRSAQVLFRAAMILVEAERSTEAAALAAELPQELQGPDLWYRTIAETELASRRSDAAAITRFEEELAKSRGTWLARLHAGLVRLRAHDPASAIAHLNWCVEHRHEAAAAYLDDVPTIRYWADAWYWSGVASEAAGDRQTAAARYSSFLEPRAGARDTRTEDVRRRLERVR